MGAAARAARRSASIGVLVERLLLRRLYGLDNLYGLLLTFGLTLIIEGLFHHAYGISGQLLPGARRRCRAACNLGFMFLPIYRAWVVVVSICRLPRHLVRDRADASSAPTCAPAPRTRGCVQAFGVNVPLMFTLTYGVRRRARRVRRRDGGADLPGDAADGLRPHHRRVRGGGDRRHGLDRSARSSPASALGLVEGLTQVPLPGGLERGGLRGHGDRAAGPPGGAVREGA